MRRSGSGSVTRSGVLEDGRKVTAELFRKHAGGRAREEEPARQPVLGHRGHYDDAAKLLDEMSTAPEFMTFLTLAAYRKLGSVDSIYRGLRNLRRPLRTLRTNLARSTSTSRLPRKARRSPSILTVGSTSPITLSSRSSKATASASMSRR